MKQGLRLLLQEFLFDRNTLDGNSVVERVQNLLDKLREYIQLNRDTKIEAMFLQVTDQEKATLFDDPPSKPLTGIEASKPQSTLTSGSNFHHQVRPAVTNDQVIRGNSTAYFYIVIVY